MSTKSLSILVVCFFLTSCFSTQPTTKNKKHATQQPAGTIAWQKVGTVPQLDSVPIVPTEFIVAGEAPVLATRQHLVLKGGGEYKKEKEFRVIKFDLGEWKTIRYQKSYAQNWFSNITHHNNSLYMIYNWLTIQSLENGKWKEFTGGKQFSPAKVKGYQYYPKLQFNSKGTPVAMWNDGSYIKEGYTKGGKWISASQYINGKWTWIGRRAFAKDAGKPLFCLSNDQPWALFLDFGEEVYKDGRVILSMMTLENEKWTYKGKRGFNSGSCSSSGFDFDVYNGIPYTIFTYEDKWTGHYSTRTKHAVVMKFENNTWTTIGNLNSTGEIRNPKNGKINDHSNRLENRMIAFTQSATGKTNKIKYPFLQ